MTSPIIAQNIDEVITALEKIIQDAEATGDRLGYFAALYHKVTVKVKEGIEAGQFGDGNQLERLDVIFANRYLYAYEQWKAGLPVSRSWQVAFETSKRSSKLVLQHLLLGMNAHINYDLGIATVDTANGGPITSLRKDFNAINDVLAALSYGVINELRFVSPFLSFLGFSGTGSNSMLIQFSISNARDGSWCFAEELLDKQGADREKFLSGRDTDIAALGQSMITARGFLKFGIWLIHLFEWKNVKRIINVLRTRKKPYKKEMEVSKTNNYERKS